MIFNKIFADQSGMANAILANFGIEPIRWHADVLASHIAIATMVDFRWTGYTTLILLAAMQAIPATSTRPRSSTAPAAGGRSARSRSRR